MAAFYCCRTVSAAAALQLQPAGAVRWDIYRVANKGKLLGTIEADYAGEAVKKAAEEFKTENAWRLIAVQRK